MAWSKGCSWAGVHAGFCKQQLWPLFHYLLPLMPSSAGRFNSELWQAYVKANKVSRPPLLCMVHHGAVSRGPWVRVCMLSRQVTFGLALAANRWWCWRWR